jgi:hypothetical protein
VIVGEYRALSDPQRQLRDVVCRRRTGLEARLRLLKEMSYEPRVDPADVEVVRGWLFEVHGHEHRPRRPSC